MNWRIWVANWLVRRFSVVKGSLFFLFLCGFLPYDTVVVYHGGGVAYFVYSRELYNLFLYIDYSGGRVPLDKFEALPYKYKKLLLDYKYEE